MKTRLLLFLASSLFLVGCQSDVKWVSATEAANTFRGPVYTISKPFQGMNIDTYHHEFDNSEATTITYFVIEQPDGDVIRLARLQECTACGPIGSEREITGIAPELLPEPFAVEADTCNVISEAYQAEVFDGQEYLTCLYWEVDRRKYKLYSIWNREETWEFLALLQLAD